MKHLNKEQKIMAIVCWESGFVNFIWVEPNLMAQRSNSVKYVVLWSSSNKSSLIVKKKKLLPLVFTWQRHVIFVVNQY